MIALILSAGFGTRLYPLTLNKPKALLDVAGRPVIDYLVDQILRFFPLETIHVVCNDRFFDHFVQWQQKTAIRAHEHGKEIVLHNNGRKNAEERLGAIADLGLMFNRADPGHGAVIAASDNIYLADLLPVWRRFVETGENLIPVIRQDDRGKLQRTGVATLGRGDRVRGFEEKPAEPPSPWSVPPLYFLNRSALNRAKVFASQPDPPDGMGYLIRYLVDEETICAVKMEAGRLDVGDPASYEDARHVLADGAVYDALPGIA
jgi:glucose-1-phosphate thymidylyltransferase